MKFEKIPIIDKDSKFFFVSDKDKEYKSEDNINSRKILFRIYSTDERLSIKKFIEMPISVNLLDDYVKPHKVLYPSNRYTKPTAVNSFFDSQKR